jgi:hypothetical protein
MRNPSKPLHDPGRRVRTVFLRHRCAAVVPEGGHSVRFRQCRRRPVMELRGIGFCRQHGLRIQAFIAKMTAEGMAALRAE